MRLRKIAETLLDTLEKEYGFKPKADATLNNASMHCAVSSLRMWRAS